MVQIVENKFQVIGHNLQPCYVRLYSEVAKYVCIPINKFTTTISEKHQFNLSYDQKNQLAAYWRQSTLGPYHPDKLNPGYFDFVGNDRK